MPHHRDVIIDLENLGQDPELLARECDALAPMVYPSHYPRGFMGFDVPGDHPARSVDGLLLSPHRTGGMPEAFQAIGRLVVADLELVLRGLPPVACRRAERETVARLRSRPIDEPE